MKPKDALSTETPPTPRQYSPVYMCYMGDKYTGEYWRGVGGVSVDSASFGFKNLNYPYDYSEGSCSSGGAAACPELYAGNPGSHLVDAATCSSGRTKCK